MRPILVLFTACFLTSTIQAQNVGIGITSPTARLHVANGTVRLEGPASPGGTALDIGGYGSISVDAVGSAGGRLLLTESGNLGIGNTAPGYPLSFGTVTGDKITFWGNSGPHYGIGLQNALLQFYTDGAGSDIAFG